MLTALAAVALTICAPGPRDDCVVDGDTFWLSGEKVRIADIDTPELNGECSGEIQRAVLAQERLLALLNAAPFTIHRQGAGGRGRYGRTLAIVTNASGSVGDRLVAEGLARTRAEDAKGGADQPEHRRNHRANLLAKLRVKNVLEAVQVRHAAARVGCVCSLGARNRRRARAQHSALSKRFSPRSLQHRSLWCLALSIG